MHELAAATATDSSVLLMQARARERRSGMAQGDGSELSGMSSERLSPCAEGEGNGADLQSEPAGYSKGRAPGNGKNNGKESGK